MAAKKIEIIYDIDGKAIDVAVDSTLNLKKQVVELTKALRSTKEGTDEFKVLSSKLSDVQDGLAKTTAKSKDLFSSLSMIPGPVGQFFSQLQGAVELMKTFSSFTLKDLQFQFKETANDIADIGKNITGAKNAAEGGIASGAGATGGAASGAGAGAAAGVASTNALVDSRKKLVIVNGELISKEEAMINASLKQNQNIANMTAAEAQLYMAQRKATTSTVEQTAATESLATAEATATFWTNALNVALKALGIGLIIGAVVLLVGWLVDLAGAIKKVTYEFFGWKTNAQLATEENDKLSSSFIVLKNAIAGAQDAIKDQTELLELQAKAAGKSAEEIYQIQVEGLNKRKEAQKKADTQLLIQLGRTSTAVYISEEEKQKKMKEVQDAMIENSRKSYDLYIEGEKMAAKETLRIADKRREEIKKNQDRIAADNKQHLEKVKNDNKTANETEITNLREIGALKLTEERDRQRKELENQKLAEEDKIKGLEITTKRKGELVAQIEEKYGYKLKDLNKKFKDEDIKAGEEFTNKLADISNAAIKDETDRQINARQEKYRRDLLALELDKEFIKMSEEAKAHYRAQLKDGLDNDVAKLEHDARVKKLDEELKFMQIRNEGIRKGTTAFFDAQRELLDKSQERELEQLDLTEQQKTDIKAKYAALRKDIDKQEFETYLGYLNQGLGAVQNVMSQQAQINNLEQQNELDTLKNTVADKAELAKQEDKVKEKYFYKNRDAQYAQAMISAFQAAISAYSSLAAIPVVGPALGAAAAAIALGFGIKQANLIKKQQYVSSFTMPSENGGGESSKPAMANYGKNYGDGGMIEGPRHAGGGVMINAEGGEAVMTRGAVTMFAPLLSAMNQMGGGTSFNKGALGQANNDHPKVTEPATPQPMVVKTYVVSSELTTEAQKQARLKDLSTL